MPTLGPLPRVLGQYVWQEAEVACQAESAQRGPDSHIRCLAVCKYECRRAVGTICKNRSFIKEKGFHHPDDFFQKTIEAKGWRALCQPPRPAAMSVVREFYANLASHVLKRVRVRGVLVDFSAESINSFYSLEHVPAGPFDQLREHLDYPEVIRILTKGRG